MNNTRQLTELYKVDITKITNINITSIGLLEVFGKTNYNNSFKR